MIQYLLTVLVHFWIVGGVIYTLGFVFQTRLIGNEEGHKAFWELFHQVAKGKFYRYFILYVVALVMVFVFWPYYIVSDLFAYHE